MVNETKTQRKRRLEKKRRKLKEKHLKLSSEELEEIKKNKREYMRKYRASQSEEKRATRLQQMRQRNAESRRLHNASLTGFLQAVNTVCDKICEICTKRCYPHQISNSTVNTTTAPYLPDEFKQRNCLITCRCCKYYLSSEKKIPPSKACGNCLIHQTIPLQTSVMAPIDVMRPNVDDELQVSRNLNEITCKTTDNFVNVGHELKAEEFFWKKTAIKNPTEPSIEAEASAATSSQAGNITMIETKEETETIGEELPPAPPEDVECRACLQRIDYEAGLLDMFQAWEPPWNGMGESIAQDLARLTNVNITTEDSYSKLICQFCHKKLLEACSFVVNVRINDRLLRQRAETLHEQDDTWPKFIQVDRNINSNVFNSAMDVEIKQEVLSDDETYPSGAEDTFKGGADIADDTDNTFNEMEIKIEPEEIMHPAPFQITVNETITPENTLAIHGTKGPAKDENIKSLPASYALRSKNPRNTAKAYAIPSPTLDMPIKKKKNVTNDAGDAQESERNIFSDAQELELVDYLLIARKLCHGLTSRIVRQFAYQYASGNINTYAQTWAKHEAASYNWFYKFMNRHKQLTMEFPEVASLSAGNRKVGSFFDSLRNLYVQYDFSPRRIWNVDETAITTIYKPNEMVGVNPIEQGGKVTSGDTVTVCGAINALGGCLAPFIIFPRKGWQKKLIDHGLPGTEGASHTSGRMTGAKFLLFLNFFVKHVQCSKDNPCLIILDSHESHITIDSITFCKDRGIELLTTPPYMSQKLQPLSTIFKQLGLQYRLVCDTWIGLNPTRPLTIANFAECLGKAYPNVMTTNNIQNSFANIGICPFNPSVFTDILSPGRDMQNVESIRNEETTVNQHASLYIIPESIKGATDLQINATNDVSEIKVSNKPIKEENIQ